MTHVAAGISSSPGITSATGDTSGATLRVLRPDTMADDAVATYLIQAYSDEKGNTKVGLEGARPGCLPTCRPQPRRWMRAVPTAAARNSSPIPCTLPHSMLAVWGGGEGQQHGPECRRQDPGHCLCVCLPIHHRRQAVVQGHGGGGRHAQ